MKPIIIIGLVLVLLAILTFGYQGVAYVTTRDTVARVGPVEVQADRVHAVPLAPVLGGVALVAGIGLIVIGAFQSRPAT